MSRTYGFGFRRRRGDVDACSVEELLQGVFCPFLLPKPFPEVEDLAVRDGLAGGWRFEARFGRGLRWLGLGRDQGRGFTQDP